MSAAEIDEAALDRLLEAAAGVVHFSDALNYRNDTLSVALRQWISQLAAELKTINGAEEKG